MADKIIRTYKYRIYPTKRQALVLNEHLAICCELYNAALQERRDAWRREQICLCGAEVRKTLAVREHRCLSCGLVADRDHISAQLILSRASGSPSDANVGDLMPCVV